MNILCRKKRSLFGFDKGNLNKLDLASNITTDVSSLNTELKTSLSNLNLGLEFGKKGTTSNNLVQENYIILNIGFSLNDKWFVKSKFR